MLHSKLTHPKSIAVIGGSNDPHKPGGKMVENLLKGQFKGQLYIVNPKEERVQGLICTKNIHDLPDIDLAILAIPAEFCYDAVKVLSEDKQCRGFIIISAGFSEGDEKGKDPRRADR